jgi:hypothetical protein
VRGPHRADLGDRHLVVGQHLEQKRLELLVAPVDLVHQQHRRPVGLRDRLQQRALEQEGLAEDRRLALLHRRGGSLVESDAQQLLRIVPLVQGGRRVEPS